MNELELDVEGRDLDDIHAEGLRRAEAFYGAGWAPSLIACEARPHAIVQPTGKVHLWQASLRYRGIPRQRPPRWCHPWNGQNGLSCMAEAEWMVGALRRDDVPAFAVEDRRGEPLVVWLDAHGEVWWIGADDEGPWSISEEGVLERHSRVTLPDGGWSD